MYAGFKKRLRASMRMKTRHNGIVRFKKTLPLLLMAIEVLSGMRI
jgi:hypothetical protein